MSGLRPEELGVAQILEIGQAERPSLSAHRAAKPPAQARLGLLKDALATRRIRDGICEMPYSVETGCTPEAELRTTRAPESEEGWNRRGKSFGDR